MSKMPYEKPCAFGTVGFSFYRFSADQLLTNLATGLNSVDPSKLKRAAITLCAMYPAQSVEIVRALRYLSNSH